MPKIDRSSLNKKNRFAESETAEKKD